MLFRSTITGSIGVFGVIPNMEGLFRNKLGITFDWAVTNKNGDYIPVMKPLSAYQTNLLQRDIDHIYDVFIGKVAEGRKISKSSVDSIGEGRIWSGVDAKKLNLVDDYGGLTLAIESAANLAQIKDYRVVEYPEQKEFIQALIDELTGHDPTDQLREVLGPEYAYYEYIKNIRAMKGIQARMLMDLEIR